MKIYYAAIISALFLSGCNASENTTSNSEIMIESQSDKGFRFDVALNNSSQEYVVEIPFRARLVGKKQNVYYLIGDKNPVYCDVVLRAYNEGGKGWNSVSFLFIHKKTKYEWMQNGQFTPV